MKDIIHTYEGFNARMTMIGDWQSSLKKSKKSDSPRYIHYTGIGGFYAMLKDYIEHGKQYVTLFPSQIQYLNDSQEYREGLAIVKANGYNGENLNDDIYVTCFCGSEDLLSQWKYYGQNSGISIEFDFIGDDKKYNCKFIWWNEKEYESNKESALKGIKEMEMADAFNLLPYPVYYEKHKSRYKNMCKHLRKKYTDVTDAVKAGCFVPYCKNAAFKEENESRLIFYPMIKAEGHQFNPYTNIVYRVTSDKYIPQFTCKVFYDIEAQASRKIPVKNIIVGPGHNQLIIFNSVIHMLERDQTSIFFLDENAVEDLKSGKPVNHFYRDGNNGRITYSTSDGITIQMSTTPFRP